jgi:peptide/nickel transport system ATP-binding protein
MNPDLILADEAVSALDVSLRVEMMDLMLELQDSFETSLLFISHDLANARYLTEKANGRIGVMYMGEIVEIGTPQEILYNPKHPYTKVMLWSTPILDPDLAREVLEEEPPVRSIDIPDALNPPSGCKFHTRCPQAREECTRSNPELRPTDDGGDVACFLEQPEHDYWDTDYLDPVAADERTLDWDE